MIFRPELAKLIRQGRKTQTRRIAQSDRCRYEAGKSYAVQPGRGREGICRITITGIRCESLGDLTLKDAKREGFVTTDEFFGYWRDLYGHVDRDLLVWVISFTLGDATDTPRLLAARPGAPHGDYVSNPHLALRDEGEAVSETEQSRFSHVAFARDDILRREMVKNAVDVIEGEIRALKHALRTAANADRRTERALAAVERTTGALRESAA